ncbi:hypothetical protein T07_9273 [Trichinella nelsoni]|uniref:Uncharacterized protein n=1 Tax=Trichinella nelsoni TaxID=6336 RepID=A0A0V0SHE6_9BILA|nr:hypothetical protein T07_9273 [Trichinella nelsoni]
MTQQEEKTKIDHHVMPLIIRKLKVMLSLNSSKLFRNISLSYDLLKMRHSKLKFHCQKQTKADHIQISIIALGMLYQLSFPEKMLRKITIINRSFKTIPTNSNTFALRHCGSLNTMTMINKERSNSSLSCNVQ